MEKLPVPYSSRVTLVIENYGEIVHFSQAIEPMTYENLIYQLKKRKKHPESEPLVIEFESPDTMDSINFCQGYTCDVILVDSFGNILGSWTEPDYSEFIFYRTFYGVKTMLLCPEGFIRESGLIPGVSKLTLRSSMAWASIYSREVYAKELKVMSDHEIIDTLNRWVGIGYRGSIGNATRCALSREILARSFDYSIIFSPGTNGSTDSVSMSKRVKLVENRLEYE